MPTTRSGRGTPTKEPGKVTNPVPGPPEGQANVQRGAAGSAPSAGPTDAAVDRDPPAHAGGGDDDVRLGSPGGRATDSQPPALGDEETARPLVPREDVTASSLVSSPPRAPANTGAAGLMALVAHSRTRRAGEVKGAARNIGPPILVQEAPELSDVKPPGTVGMPVRVGDRLDVKGLAHEWAEWPRGGVTREEFDSLERLDVRAARAAMEAGTDEWAAEAWRRCMVGHGQRQYQVPASIRADRTWLLDPRDAPYVEGMAAYLFDEVGDEPPVLGTRAYVAPPSLGVEEREHRRTALAVSILFGRVMTFDDLSVVRTVATHRSRVSPRSRASCAIILIHLGRRRPCRALPIILEGRSRVQASLHSGVTSSLSSSSTSSV